METKMNMFSSVKVKRFKIYKKINDLSQSSWLEIAELEKPIY